MGNKEDIEKNIEINDENVDKNVVSEEIQRTHLQRLTIRQTK